ncbi:RsmB/NOP family class I SAM-dependent RNA methyltransferase [Cohnella sp. CFH 77786]|uniref:RsmB/NOP family class I SAM-dependent RNA methyltransferase n=1 Tax=Cohnella sp. CFH 77786 TaxID=2662265 RepID=UPI00210845AB|nr:RsmB/NOP family class I SAM-dependent RNA methyltransferase [Cohnella sp. CFH 77786]
MKLPQEFIRVMRELLREEADAFFASYDKPRTSGLRANGLKLAPARLRDMSDMARAPVPWAEGGFYTEEEDRPGKHPHYHLGLYYIQEPSAMLPAELLDVRPGHRVLDLCAAPGGKTTQLAAKLRGEGVLVTNDNAAERTKALAKNVELAGARNAVILNEEPGRIADAFGAWFDRVLVDAPCSGEGMFRKDEDMIRQWERHSVEKCSLMQRDILRDAARLVAPGGKLVYSTCTFSPRENEGTIARFLSAFPDFRVVPSPFGDECGMAPGRPDWLDVPEAEGLSGERLASLAGAIRLWPHRCRGEGHFAVVLERMAGADGTDGAVREEDGTGCGQASKVEAAVSAKNRRFAKLREDGGKDETLAKFEAFRSETLPDWHPPGRLVVQGSSVYSQPEGVPSLDRLKTVRPGWFLGAASKHRFEPSQALAMGLRELDATRVLRLSSGHPDCLRYLKGETLQPEAGQLSGRGWMLVCVDGFPAGWGRWDGFVLKNERLPGWRWI